MGRIKTRDIKGIGNELLGGSNAFAADFESNKAQVSQLGLNTSKRVRNKLAGYITRHKRIEQRKTVK